MQFQRKVLRNLNLEIAPRPEYQLQIFCIRNYFVVAVATDCPNAGRRSLRDSEILSLLLNSTITIFFEKLPQDYSAAN